MDSLFLLLEVWGGLMPLCGVLLLPTKKKKKDKKILCIGQTMVLILDGNLEHIAHAWRKIGIFREEKSDCDCTRSNQMA